MSIPAGLPRHRPDHQSYQRPNQRWVCGWLRAGYQCRPGPSPAGECLNRAECSPRRRGGGWLCTRAREDGGPCSQGPLPDGRCRHTLVPCQPLRSLQRRRLLVVLWTGFLTLGLLLLGYAGPWQETFLTAGELSSRHTSHSAGCSTCHDHAATDANSASMSGRCQNCHNLGEHSDNPHGADPARLAALTAQAADNTESGAASAGAGSWLLKLAGWSVPADFSDRGLACAVCHSEHRGQTGFRAESLDDLQCQSCHTRQFASLSAGHPQFSGYPYQRRTRIIFDHARHAYRHFSDTAKLFRCSECHQPDDAGQQMQVKSFAGACLDCHGNQALSNPSKVFHHGAQIVEKRATVAFITLPRLDLKTLSKHDLLPAGWPQDAQKSSRDGLSDLGLTPFTELLLATDATTAGALQRLHTADVKLSRLTQAGAGELGDVAQVLTALQALLWQLAQNDAGWQHRLQQLSAAVTDDYPAAALTAQMPAPLRRTPALSWFGERLTAAEANQPPTTTDEPADEPADDGGDDPTPAGSDAVRTGSWDEDRFSLQYHPGGHADDFLKSWLELSLQLSRTELALAPFAQTLFDELADRSAGPGEAKGAGRCTKCHSIEQYDGSMLINWQARQPQPEYHDFTRFRHQPHLQLNTAEACTLCHKLQQEQPAEAAKSKFLQSFLSSNEPAVFTGNFAAMDKTTCDTCHSADSAGQSCVTCHNYHVGEFTPTMLQHTGNLLRPQQ